MADRDDVRPRVGRTAWILKRAERTAAAALYDTLRDLELTPSQYGVLQALVRMQKASSADLARACFVTPQAMTGLVAGLERQGYIVRKPRRSSRVIEATVTAVGRRVFDDATERVQRVEADLTSGLSAAEVEQLRALLERCVHALEGSGLPVPDDDRDGLRTDDELEPVAD
jgi:DNA-binding MarR family transcriptional regulator